MLNQIVVATTKVVAVSDYWFTLFCDLNDGFPHLHWLIIKMTVKSYKTQIHPFELTWDIKSASFVIN